MYAIQELVVRWPERLLDLLFEWSKAEQHCRALWVLQTQKGKVVCGAIIQIQTRGID